MKTPFEAFAHPRQQIVLVGLPGVGKTTVGHRLAHRFHLSFADVDRVIEQQHRCTVAQIFAQDGEAAFRTIEVRTTCKLLTNHGVIALGGGAVVNPVIRAALSGRCVIWLSSSLAEGIKRIGHGNHRPLLQNDIATTLARLANEREPYFRGAARYQIDTDGCTIDHVVDKIAAIIGLAGKAANR